MNPVDVRLALLRTGYVPVPAKGKAPHITGWQTKTATNADEIAVQARQFADHTNTGILTKTTPAVDIDITLLPAAEAAEALAREEFEERGYVMMRIGKAPKRAFLLRTDEPFDKITAAFTAPDGSEHKIEILGTGQQVIVDGIHPDTGKAYSWHGGSPLSVPRDDLPYVRREDVVAFLDKASKLLVEQFGFQPIGGKAKANGAGHDDGQYERADWAELIGNIIAGRDLHDSAKRLAASYLASGMDTTNATRAIEALFLTSDTPRDERWKARFDDIGRAVRSAKEKFAKPDQAPPAADQSPTAEDLKAMRFEPIKYVVRGVIVEGLTLLAAKPKIGKSWLMLHAAIAVARGGFTLGEIHCEEGDVLYCALEDNLRRLRSRLEKLLGHDQVWPNRLCFKTEMPRLTEGGLEVIMCWLKSVPHPRLVVVDTLAMVSSPKKRDESSYDADYSAVKELRHLANEYGVAIVLIHHLRKAESDDPFDTVSGTLGLTGAPDTILVLKRDTSGTVILHGRGRDLIEIEKAMTFSKDACTWTITGEAGEARTTGERLTIIDAVREIGEPATPSEIASAAQLKPGNVRRLVLKMTSNGLLKKAGRGRYMPADAELVTGGESEHR